jgi:uncharacterized membrane protein YphA (DoxX/SURF4 family)
MMNKVLLVAIWLFAFIFIIFGMNKFYTFMKPPPPTDTGAQLLMVGMFNSYLKTLVGIVEVFSSCLLLFRRTRFFGFLIIIPIILNIILYHLTTNDFSNPIILIIGILFGGLCYSQKDAVKELFKIQSNI